MKKSKEFVLAFLEKEAVCWTNREKGEVDRYNKSVQELYAMTTASMLEAFGIALKKRLREEENPSVHKAAYLFKLSEYLNEILGTIWLAYTSYENPLAPTERTSMSRGFIISTINNELKIIGVMSVALNESTLEPVGWEKSVYNPPNLNIHDLGEFIAAERYFEPKDDGFSLQDYLADK